MGEQVERIIIDLEARDDATPALTRVRARLARISEDTKKSRIESDKFNKSLRQENKEHERTFELLKKLTAEQDQLTQETKEFNAARREAISNARAFGQVGRDVQQIGGALGDVGAIAGPGAAQIANVGPDILRTVESLGLLKQQLPLLTTNLVASAGGALALTAATAAVAAALIAVALVYKVFQSIVENSKEATEKLINVNKRYAEILATSTTKEVEATIKANEDRNKALELERERLRAFIDATEEVDGVAGAILDLNDALNLNLGGYEDVQDRLNEVNKELDQYADLNTQLAGAMQEGATAAADLAQREKELADERERILAVAAATELAKIKERGKLRADAEISTQTATTEGVTRELDNLHIRYRETIVRLSELRDLYDNNIISLTEYRTEQRAVNVEQEKLVFQMGLLKNAVLPLVQAREREVATLKLIETNTKLTRAAYENAIKSQTKFADSLADFEAKRLQAEEDFADKTIAINEKRHLSIIQEDEKAALDRVNDLADHYKDLGEIDQDFFEDRADLLATIGDDLNELDDEKLIALKEFNKTEIRATEDHLKRLNDIRLRAQSSIRSAAARLDALGLFEAQQAAIEELKNENEKFEIDKKRRAEDFRDLKRKLTKERREILRANQQALRDLERQHQRERQSAITAFNEKIRREDQQAALERSQQQQRWALEDQQRLTQFNNEAADRSEHFSLLLTLTSNGLYQIELTYQAWLDSMSARTSSIPVGAPATNLQTGHIPAFAAGGVPPINRPVLVGERGPEIVRFKQPVRVFPSGQRPSAFDGASIIINIDGSRAPQQVAYAVRKELKRIVTEN